MQKSGWTPGTALGASSVPIPVSQSTASQVKIRIKDDTLGLGANLKSRDIEAQRTGLDAFQGLLGRLNAKDQSEAKAVEEKIENKKLAMFAMGRWGGMVFVPGGVLVQEDPKKKLQVEIEDPKSKQDGQDVSEDSDSDQKSKSKSKSEPKKSRDPKETPEQRAIRKAEKRARKEARLLKKLQKESQRTGTGTDVSATSSSNPSTTNTGTSTPIQISEPTTISITSITQAKLKNGRHLLRGRNIQAKKMAFSDARGLDQIFMRRVETKTEA